MPKPTWEVAIDFEQDNEFSGADLITEDVLSCTWSLGFAGPYEPIAKDGQLTLTLRNTDKRYSPEYSRSPFYPNFTQGKLVRVRSTYDGMTRQHFIGWIDSIDPTPGKYLSRQTTVRASGFLLKAQDYEAFIPVQEGKTADQVIDAVLRRAVVFPPGFYGRWTLGVATKGELGHNTTLGELSDYLEAETGISTFSIIGDQWSDGVTVYGALRDAVGREGGRLVVDREGKIIFWNRNHLPLMTAVQATFDNAMAGMEYEYGDLFINKATVRARPRKIGSNNETLGVLDKATKIPAGESKEISFRYADTVNSGATVAGKNAVAPVQTTDFTANSMEDGSGTNYTSSVTAAIVEESGTRCKVRYSNAAGVEVWLQPGAVIRGIKHRRRLLKVWRPYRLPANCSTSAHNSAHCGCCSLHSSSFLALAAAAPFLRQRFLGISLLLSSWPPVRVGPGVLQNTKQTEAPANNAGASVCSKPFYQPHGAGSLVPVRQPHHSLLPGSRRP